MPRNPRHDQILSLLQNLRQISVVELTERLGVSSVTIRKDLTFLEELGLVTRSHGGARLAQDVNAMPPVSARKTEGSKEKRLIVERAARLIHDGDSVFLDAGSTTAMLAEELINRPLHVITNSLEILNIMASSEMASLTAVGGNFRREGGSYIGPGAEAAVQSMQFDIAFLGATGFTADGSFLTGNSIEGSLKRCILEASGRTVILADSSKFGVRAFSKFAQAELVDVLICDRDLDEDAAEGIIESGIELIYP